VEQEFSEVRIPPVPHDDAPAESMYPGGVQYPEGKSVVGDKTMQLLKAMRGQLGDTSATRSVDAVAAANSLGMDSDTHEFARRVQDLVRAGYLEPDPNCAAPTTQGIYRITFSGIYAADNH
jgi:hypothetical protein